MLFRVTDAQFKTVRRSREITLLVTELVKISYR